MFFNKKKIAIFLAFLVIMVSLITLVGKPNQKADVATRMVTFTDSYNGQDIFQYEVEVGKDSEMPKAPHHENFVFSGWYQYNDRDSKIDSFDKILYDTHAIALYAADLNNNGIADDQDTYYNVTFIDGVNKNELKVERVLVGKGATAPLTIEHDGYTFTGWDVDYTRVLSDLTVTANYIKNNVEEPVQVKFYKVTFVDGEDNNVIKSVNVQEGFSATAPTAPTHQNKLFEKWDGAYTNVRSNRTVTAKYTDDLNNNGTIDYLEEHYSVEFVALENGSLEGKTRYDNLLGGLTFNELGIVIPTPKPNLYYAFEKWDRNFDTTVNGSTTYNASFTVENDVNGNNIPDEKEYRKVIYTDGVEEVVFEDKVFDKLLDGFETPLYEEEITRDNYIFNGWDKEISNTVNGDQTYEAVWLEDFNNNRVPDKDEVVAIKYNAGVFGTIDGETSLVTEKIYLPGYDKYPEAPTVTPNDNYAFKEWTPTYSTDEVIDKEVIEFTATYFEDKNGNNKDDLEEKVAIIYYGGERGKIDGNRRFVTEEIYLPGYDKYPTPPELTVDSNYKFKAWDPSYDTDALIDENNLTFTARYFKDRNDNNIDDEEEYIHIVFYAGAHGRIFGGKLYATPGQFLAGFDKYPEPPEVVAEGIYKFKEWTPNYSNEEVIDPDKLSFTAVYFEDENDNNIDDSTELLTNTFNMGNIGQ